MGEAQADAPTCNSALGKFILRAHAGEQETCSLNSLRNIFSYARLAGAPLSLLSWLSSVSLGLRHGSFTSFAEKILAASR
jgi:hypothetical protein